MASVTKDILENCTLTYFPLAARGEPARLLLAIAGVDYVDRRVPGAEWGKEKASTPWGNMPVLELKDGAKIGQARTISRFIGRLTGLYPSEDAVAAARVDEIMDALEDLMSTLNNTGRGLEPEAKLAARKEGVAKGGSVYTLLERVDAFIEKNGKNGFTVGDSLTVADVHVSVYASICTSGFYDGAEPATLEPFKNIQKVRHTVASHEAVQQHYAKRGADIHPFEQYLRDA